MTFRLFGVDVEIQFGFWFTAVMLSWPFIRRSEVPEALIMVGVILISVLAHEFGHAFLIKRHRIEPEIALHWMGGTTTWRMIMPLRRLDHVLISLAGPFAGFALAGIAFAIHRLVPDVSTMPPLGRFALGAFLDINLYWGIINLLPVLPFDGGHVLEHALGPKRVRITAAISFLVGTVVAVYFLANGNFLGGFIFGMGAVQSYQRFRAEPAIPMGNRRVSAPDRDEEPLPPELSALLRSARQAIDDEQLDRAEGLASQALTAAEALSQPGRQRATSAALQVMAWVRLLGGRAEEAEDVLRKASRMGPVDAALAGAVLKARANLKEARKVLEAARAAGDERKEIFGPLIQILLEQNEVARAAAVAFDVVESLSEDDARKMAELAFDGGAFDWSARLCEAIFKRERRGEDAYAAARAYAKNGEPDQAIALLRRAVEAGFSDRARAWSDSALASLRDDAHRLEAVFPRP